jgi:hypothetical protein
LRLLISAGSDVNSAALDGESPLHLAAAKGSRDMVDELVLKRRLRISMIRRRLTGPGTPGTGIWLICLTGRPRSLERVIKRVDREAGLSA